MASLGGAAGATGATGATAPSIVSRLLLVLVLCLSAFIQLTVASRTVVDVPLRSDAGDYFSYAFNMENFGTYSRDHSWAEAPGAVVHPDKVRSPGYPLFLASLGTPEPTDAYIRRVMMVQALLGVLSVWLSYLLAREVFGFPSALGAAGWVAISPHLATINTYLLTEALFTPLLLLSALLLIRAARQPRLANIAAVALVWGACSLVRPTTALFPLLLIGGAFVLPALKRHRKAIAMGTAIFLATLAPWSIRNLSPAVESSGTNLMVGSLAHGSYPGFMYEDRPETFGFPYRFDPEIDAISKDLPSILGHIAHKFREQPGKYLAWYLIGKPMAFLSWGNIQAYDVLIYPALHTPYYEDAKFAFLRWVSASTHVLAMLLGVIGMFLALLAAPVRLGLAPGQHAAARWLALLVLYAIAFHMIVAPFPRYAIPFRPMIYILGLLALRALWVTVRHRGRFAAEAHSGSV